ncbi:MAG: ABC transporter permease [Planctomycetaceae bacterium]|jgi:molybdate transport system permease protein|nr:ABC transporter permease [Planctomycetaceae bacterium]
MSTGSSSTEPAETDAFQPRSDLPFYIGLMLISGVYVVLLIGLLVADVAYMGLDASADTVSLPAALEWSRPVLRPILAMGTALAKPEIRYAVKLTMISCLVTAILSLLTAVPAAYLISRRDFPGKNLLDAILDIPIVLPPLVVGLSLLILFQFWPFRLFSRDIVFQIPAVVLAQYMVATAFAVRVMRATFDQIDPRLEQVALTLGCNQSQAFWRIVLPQAGQGMLTAGTLAWARALGEFGPLLIFAGATRMKTEVLSTTVFLEMSIGNLEGAVAVSLLMVGCAVAVLVIARIWGSRGLSL